MRKTKKLLSIIMSAALVATALPATAFAGGRSGNISGDGEILDALVYSIVVPTDLAFTVNPLQFDYDLDGTTYSDSIISTGYGFVNKSSVPVQLNVNFSFATPEGITIAENLSDITDTADEAPTIYMDIEPTDQEPQLVVADDAQFVTFSSVDFVSGPAVLVSGQTISFKMEKANYEFDSNKVAQYKDNNLAGDTVGFRFGGKASMFSDWKDKSLKINATYGISVISPTDYADATNSTSGGFNVLDHALVDVVIESGPSLKLTPSGEIGFNNISNDWTPLGLYCIYNDDGSPLSATKDDILAMVRSHIDDPSGMTSETLGGNPVILISTQNFQWDLDTNEGFFTPTAMINVDGYYFQWFTVVQNKTTGEKMAVVSDAVVLHK